MGTAITSILHPEPTTLEALAHKTLAVDAFNMLYQFVTTIRMRDGTPLKNSGGHITSHLVGLFGRTTTFLENNLKLIFVFDGETPELKTAERERRKEAKQQAKKEYAKAEATEDVDAMKKYAGRTSTLNKEMIEEAQELLDALGIPWMTAPAEAEAQASHLVKLGAADYVASQDTDCLLFGAPYMVKNLSITGRRRKPGTNITYMVQPEIINLQKEKELLGLTQKQLIALGMIVGTDFNPGGIKGLGPKKGLKLLEEHGENLELVFKEAKWDEHHTTSWKEVYKTIHEMPVQEKKEFVFNSINREAVKKLLVGTCEFNEGRVEKTLDKLTAANQQKGLGEFF